MSCDPMGPCSPYKVKMSWGYHYKVYEHNLDGWYWMATFRYEFEVKAYIKAGIESRAKRLKLDDSSTD